MTEKTEDFNEFFEEISEEERKRMEKEELEEIKKDAKAGVDTLKLEQDISEVGYCHNCIFYAGGGSCREHPTITVKPYHRCSGFKAKKGKLYTREEIEIKELRKQLKKEKKEKESEYRTSLYINNNKHIFAEQVYGKYGVAFCVYHTDTGEITYEDYIDVGSGIKIKPIIGEEVEKKAILLPSCAEDYGDDKKLDNEIRNYTHKWLDIPKDATQFSIWNVKRSWVFQRFHTLNYLRVLGEPGTGKSRYLDVVGSIHYKPIQTSGATTAAPVFRIIDKWRGTLEMDEADLKISEETADIIKIINIGYEKGKFVMRCDQNDAKVINFFNPYCPKILATRGVFKDKAVESRCITHVMKGTSRDDIPLNLNDDFWNEALRLRNKLLMWRFKNYYKIDPSPNVDFDLGDLEPRVKQIVSSFISLFKNDTEQLENFKKFIKKYQDELIEDRRNSFEGSIVVAIYDLVKSGKKDINSQDIVNEGGLVDYKGDKLHPRSLSSKLKALGFESARQKRVDTGENKRCIPLKKEHLLNLFKRYGCNDVTNVTIITETLEKNLTLDKMGKIDGGATDTIVTTDTSVTEEEIIYSDKDVLLDAMRQLDDGDVVDVSELSLHLKWDASKFDNMLNKLKKEGEVIELRPGKLKILE